MPTSEQDKNRAKAKNYAYLLLRNRPRSRQELCERLKLKGYDDAIVDIVLADLIRAGQIDDGKFAKFLVDSRMHMNPVGDVVLKHQLKRKGVSDAVIEAALAAKGETYDEHKVALEMAGERFARLKKLDRRKATKRIYDFLLRRGFKYDTIRAVIDEIAKGQGSRVKEQGQDDNE